MLYTGRVFVVMAKLGYPPSCDELADDTASNSTVDYIELIS